MAFVQDRDGAAPSPDERARPGSRSRPPAAFALVVLALCASSARAAPLDEPFVGGMGFTGPTSASLSAIYWNPAALGLVRGTQVVVSGSVRVSSTTVTRAPIDPKTGLPSAGGTTFAPATASDLMQPAHWPPGPGAFIGISSDLGGDRFTIGFATYMPYLQQIKFPLSPAGSEPTRYQALQIDLRNLALVPALSIRFAGDFRLGIAPGFLFSTGHLMFAEDTSLDGTTTSCGGAPCPPESPQAAARYDVSSGNGLGDAKFSVTLGGGLYYRRGAVEIGLAYQSRPIGSSVPGVEVAGERTTINAPPTVAPTVPPSNVGALVTCPTGSTARCVFGDLSYKLPDVWIGGVTWRLRPGLELTAMARWIWFHVHDRIDVRLTGPTLEQAQVPEHIVLYRGFHDVWDLRGRVSYWFRERVRLGAQLRIETSAVDPSAVNAAAVDGLTVEPMALAEVRLSHRVWLSGGYGVSLMSEVTANPSVFDPMMATKCVDGGQALDACVARNAGQARPTAAGTYTRVVQDLGLTMTAGFSMRAASPAIMVTVMALACAAPRGTGGSGGRPSSAARARGDETGAPASRSGSTSGGAGKGTGGPPVLLARAPLGPLSVGKWRLPNGLTIVLAPDPTATSVSYMTWYRVGSRDENEAAGETGLAHLFEHLMFTQTKNHPVGEFDRAVEAAGGNSNAMTYYDFTAYMDDVPPSELAVAVHLEADRMVNLDLRKRQVDNERDVVVEERLSSVEDSVDGALDEIMYKQAYKTHPYRWPVIGWMKDIKAVTAEKATAFYRRFYAPDNAVVVVAGRFEEAAALALVTDAYGAIPASSGEPRAEHAPERAPAAEVRSVVERPVPADRVAIGFPAPGLGDEDRAAYEILAELLEGGPSSRLQRELVVDKALASSVHGDVAATKDPGLYALWIQMTKGHGAEEAESRVLAAVADLTTRPVPAAELAAAKARVETEFWRDLSSSHGRSERLGAFEIATGDFRRAFARADELARVTSADVQRVATNYLGRGARSVVIARHRAGTP